MTLDFGNRKQLYQTLSAALPLTMETIGQN